MNKSKFWLYCILTTLIWGSCLYLTTVSFKETWFAISLMFFVFLTEFFREIIFKTEEERELEKEKLNRPVTLKIILKGLVFIILLVSISILFFKYYENFNDTVLINMMSFIIVAIWFSSIYRAYLKT